MAWGLLAQALHKFFYLKHLPIATGSLAYIFAAICLVPFVRRAAKADRDERIIEGRVAGLSYQRRKDHRGPCGGPKLPQAGAVVQAGLCHRLAHRQQGCWTNYTDSVPLTLKKKREKILTLGPPQKAKPNPSL